MTEHVGVGVQHLMFAINERLEIVTNREGRGDRHAAIVRTLEEQAQKSASRAGDADDPKAWRWGRESGRGAGETPDCRSRKNAA